MTSAIAVPSRNQSCKAVIELLEKAVVDEKQENVVKQQASYLARFAKLQAARVVSAG